MFQQYGVGKITAIWAAATLPMAILSWVVAPALATDPEHPGLERLALQRSALRGLPGESTVDHSRFQ